MNDVASVLAEDIQNNLGLIQLVVFSVSALLAIVGSVLALRAFTMLSDARDTYWQAQQHTLAAQQNDNAPSRTPSASPLYAQSRKMRSRKNTDVLW